jgi:hypothetical protein
MKPGHCAIIVLLASILVLGAATAGTVMEWKTFDRLSYDWRGDSVPYEFVLRLPMDYDSGGEFTQIEISRGGQVLLTVTDEDGISKYLEGLEYSSNNLKKLAGRNLLHSKHLLMLPDVTGRSRYPILFLFGPGYASSPPSFHVISLGDDGIPKEILRLRNFSIFELADLNNDSVPEIIGKKCFSQSFSEGFLTYDPYSVYRFGDKAISSMIFDLALTRKYNETNYYGWAGPKCREDVTVVLHPQGGGKPVIMDTEKAKALSKK